MTRRYKVAFAVALASLLMTIAPPASARAVQPVAGPVPVDLARIGVRPGHDVSRLIVAADPGQGRRVAERIERLGGRALDVLASIDYVIADVPVRSIPALARAEGVRSLAADRVVALDPSIRRRPEETRGVARGSTAADGKPIDLGRSLQITRGEIRQPEFVAAYGARGAGALVAVLDTGVDPGHPDLQRTADGRRKIVGWYDTTGEGDVDTSATRTEPVPGIASKSGVYHLGWFKEADVPNDEAFNSDLNRDGDKEDSFGVLVVDAAEAGVYDTVYVDTNLDGDFADEKPMRAYNLAYDINRFGRDDPETKAVVEEVNFVVTRVDRDGKGVNFGYDGGQHGTHVAGIIAGNGAFQGVAPDAQIIAIRVLTSAGSGDWSGIIKGIQLAADLGATVVNMSLGGLDELNDGNDPQSLLIDRLSREKNVTFAIAAGNSGPGLNTVALPGTAAEAITVGAYVSPATFEADYGIPGVPSEGLWFFSSNGPSEDGSLKPNVVAPGSARSSVPGWAGSYAVFQGTSMATPQTAGAIALLQSAAKARNIPYTSLKIRKALEMGARELDYQAAEQGHGLIQVDAAFAHLARMARDVYPDVKALARNQRTRSGGGLYAREFAPQPTEPWTLANMGQRPVDLRLTATAPWIGAEPELRLGPFDVRRLPVSYRLPDEPGMYSALLRADDPSTYGVDLDLLTTAIVPYVLRDENGFAWRNQPGTLEAARFARYFVRVPMGAKQLVADLNVPVDASGKYQGRVRVSITRPNGMPAGQSPYAGAGDGDPAKLLPSVRLTVPNPEPGVWEVDVYASHGAPLLDVPVSKYELSIAAEGVFARPAALRLPPLPGQALAQPVEFKNYLAPFTGSVAGMGFVRPTAETVKVEQGGMLQKEFEVNADAAALRFELKPADPAAVLNLSLYYVDPQTQAVSQVLTGGQDHRLLMLAPRPGTYAVVVEGVKAPAGGAEAVLTGAVLAEPGADVTVVQGGEPRTVALGQAFGAVARMTVPAAWSEQFGAVVVRDEKGEVLGAIPIEVR